MEIHKAQFLQEWKYSQQPRNPCNVNMNISLSLTLTQSLFPFRQHRITYSRVRHIDNGIAEKNYVYFAKLCYFKAFTRATLLNVDFPCTFILFYCDEMNRAHIIWGCRHPGISGKSVFAFSFGWQICLFDLESCLLVDGKSAIMSFGRNWGIVCVYNPIFR
jgi:hypothetical protein